MARAIRSRSWTVVGMLAVEAALAVTLFAITPQPAGAQFFEDRFPFQYRRQQRAPFSSNWFEPEQFERAAPQERAPRQERPAPPVDYSKAPAPKKSDAKNDAQAAVTSTIMVLGDAMADWLAYGLEIAYADSPEIGILRRHRTNSGLIRTDPHGEDWPAAAREMIVTDKPKFVLMMIGINDRKPIREAARATPTSRIAKPAPQPAIPKMPDETRDETGAVTTPDAAASGNAKALEFRTDAWSDAYIRQIDETIAALKTSGVPVFWVGLPPLRGQKSADDIPFLNDLYRSRADKAGIIFIDIWDGFADEDGHYAQFGPDVEGQTRRLRTGDGVYFTKAGARKLAHYVEREVQRWLNARSTPVAVAIPDEPKAAAPFPAGPAGVHARPLSGPIISLTSERTSE